MTTFLRRRARWTAALSGFDTSSERGRESLSLAVGAVALTLAALGTLVIFRVQSLPIAGEDSIGNFGATASALIAMVAYGAGRSILPRPAGTGRALNVLDVAVLAFAHGVIALLTWTMLAGIVERAFIDALVFGLPSILVAGAMAAITAYAVFYSALRMNLALMAAVLAVFFVEGVLASMLAANDPHWWKDDFSSLGVADDASAVAFNLTLIVAGLIITTVARRAPLGIPTTHEHGIARVRLTLILVGVALALVGALPADTFYWAHTGFAAGMAVAFGVLVALLPRWIPGMPVAFVALGWLFIAVLLTLFAMFAAGYYTLTAVELVIGILILAWITLFIRSAALVRSEG
jgi:hypothetical membrane protein